MKSGLDFKKFKDITLLIISTYNLKLLIDGKKTNDSQYELNRSQNTVEKLTSISDLLSAEIKKKKDINKGLNDSYNQQVSDLYGSLKDLSLKVQIAKIKELHMQEKFKNLKFLVESGKFETLGNIIKEKENDNKEFDEINSQLTKVITNLQSFDKTHQLDLMKAINNPEILQKLRESKELEDFKKRLVESNLLELELELELEDNINKSSILDVDWFKGLNVLQQIGLSFLIFKGIILSCLTSIIFIFFGDYLLNKYDIEVRFPKLAKIIKLRRKFSNYYLIYNVGIIALIAIIESIFIISYMDVDIFSIIS